MCLDRLMYTRLGSQSKAVPISLQIHWALARLHALEECGLLNCCHTVALRIRCTWCCLCPQSIYVLHLQSTKCWDMKASLWVLLHPTRFPVLRSLLQIKPIYRPLQLRLYLDNHDDVWSMRTTPPKSPTSPLIGTNLYGKDYLSRESFPSRLEFLLKSVPSFFPGNSVL